MSRECGECEVVLFSSRESMSNLATSDPEFYQYLRDNDRQLLEFEDGGSDEESVAEEDRERCGHCTLTCSMSPTPV